MKLFSVLILVIIFSIISSTKQASSIDQVVSTVQFFKDLKGDYSAQSVNLETPFLVCKVKIGFEAKSSKIGNETFTSSRLKIKLEENPANCAQDDVVSSANKIASTAKKLNKRFSEKIKRSVDSATQFLKGALNRIGQAFRFRFRPIDNKIKYSVEEDSERNLNFIQKQATLKRKTSKIEDDDDDESKTNAKNQTSLKDEQVNEDYNKLNKCQKCSDRIQRITLNGEIDARYIKDCEIKKVGSTSGGQGFHVNLLSRESEDRLLKPVIFYFPTEITADVYDKLISDLKSSCDGSKKAVEISTEKLYSIYCKKKLVPKKFKTCDEILETTGKSKCSSLTKELDSLKEKVKTNESDISKEQSKMAECKKSITKNETEAVLKNEEKNDEEKEKQAKAKKLEETKASTSELKQKTDESGNNVTKLKEQKAQLEEQLKQLQPEVEKARNIIKGVTAKNEASLKDANQIDGDITANKQKKLENQLAEKDMQYKDQKLSSTQSESESELKKNNDQLETLNNEITQLESQVSNLQKEIELLITNLKGSDKTGEDKNLRKDGGEGNSVESDFTKEESQLNTLVSNSSKILPDILNTYVAKAVDEAKNSNEKSVELISAIVKNL